MADGTSPIDPVIATTAPISPVSKIRNVNPRLLVTPPEIAITKMERRFNRWLKKPWFKFIHKFLNEGF